MLKPIQDRIVARQRERAKETAGGIAVPDTARLDGECAEAEVLAAGPGRSLDAGGRSEPLVKVGDVIVYKRTSAVEIERGGEKLVVLWEPDVLGVVEP